jgi:hypothetical protein
MLEIAIAIYFYIAPIKEEGYLDAGTTVQHIAQSEGHSWRTWNREDNSSS